MELFMPNLTLLPVFIQAGESLSDPVDCSAGRLARITMPGAWDDNDIPLTFELSSDGVMYNPWFRWDGDEEVALIVTPGVAILVPDYYNAFNFVKFRSGTRDYPRPVSILREFSVAIDTGGVSG